jgi:hypothetical protein
MISALFALMLVAQEPAQAAAQESTEVQKPEKEKKICRENVGATGSRMRKKICLTQAEWDQRDQGKSVADLKTIGGR